MIYGNRNFDKKLQTFMSKCDTRTWMACSTGGIQTWMLCPLLPPDTADRDRDKKVTFQEFSNTCRKQPHLLQPALYVSIYLVSAMTMALTRGMLCPY